MPGLQKLDVETAVPLARRANDRLNEAVRAHPERFAAFAALPTADPRAAADELERTDGNPAAVPRGQGKDVERQRQAVAEAVGRSATE